MSLVMAAYWYPVEFGQVSWSGFKCSFVSVGGTLVGGQPSGGRAGSQSCAGWVLTQQALAAYSSRW